MNDRTPSDLKKIKISLLPRSTRVSVDPQPWIPNQTRRPNMLGRVVGRSVHDQSGRCCLLDLSVLYTQGYCAPVPVVGAFAHVKTGPPLLFIRSVYTDCNEE
jgi:hypothetical protein